MLLQDVMAHADLSRLVTDPKLPVLVRMEVLALPAGPSGGLGAPHAPALWPLGWPVGLHPLGWSGGNHLQVRLHCHHGCRIPLVLWPWRFWSLLPGPEASPVPVIVNQLCCQIFKEPP